MRTGRLTRGAASIVVVGVSSKGMGLIRDCLGTEAVLPTNSTSYEDAMQVVRKTRPNVLVMGFDANYEEAVRLGQALSVEVNGLHMVAISEKPDPERIRSAMRAGYREYVVLPEDGELLRRAVHDSAYTSEDDDQGKVIAVLGTKGGAGVTTYAINLAAELSAVERVCVVDLDFSMGDVAVYLDLRPQSSIHDVLRNLARLDERMLNGSVAVHPSKVHVLSQPNEINEKDEIRGEDILQVLTATADAYQYVIVDCGGRIDEATLIATTVADVVLLVCTPTVVAVKNCWRRLQMLERLGLEKDAIRLIINQWGKGAELNLKDIESNLGIEVAATITSDPATCNKAANVGKLLRDIDRRSPACLDIQATVPLVTERAAKVETGGGTKPFWHLFKK